MSVLIFRSSVTSFLTFDELKTAFRRKIGLRFFMGNIEMDYVSLFYIFSPIYQRLGLERAPICQLITERQLQDCGRQVIKFKYASYFLWFMAILIIAINILVLTVVPVGPIFGIVFTFVVYLFSVGYFFNQREQFKEEIKLIEEESKSKKY